MTRMLKLNNTACLYLYVHSELMHFRLLIVLTCFTNNKLSDFTCTLRFGYRICYQHITTEL